MVIQELVKDAGWEPYEVETAGDRSDPQLRQCFEFLVIRAQPKLQVIAFGFKKCLGEEGLERAVVADDGIRSEC
jgi:hypothetical protein